VASRRLAYGREDSFKLTNGRLLADRFLIGIRSAGIPGTTFLEIAAGLDMPEGFRSAFVGGLPEADVVLFGIEEGETGLVRKAYLEFWDKVRRRVRGTGANDPELLNLGFKWTAGDDSRSVVARYTCYPMLDLAGMLRRIRDLYDGATGSLSCLMALHLVQLAARRNAAFIYMEVSEEGTPRRSYDINLYKADLTLAEIEPELRETAARYAVPREPFEALWSRVRTRPLGHLSGGLGRDGNDFLTVYYETEPLPPRPST
jgi:hypothetical protein